MTIRKECDRCHLLVNRQEAKSWVELTVVKIAEVPEKRMTYDLCRKCYEVFLDLLRDTAWSAHA